jgi:hypothetical protein
MISGARRKLAPLPLSRNANRSIVEMALAGRHGSTMFPPPPAARDFR